MLNMGNATKAVVRAGFGPGKGVVWLDELKCRGEYILMSVRRVLRRSQGARFHFLLLPLMEASGFGLAKNQAGRPLDA